MSNRNLKLSEVSGSRLRALMPTWVSADNLGNDRSKALLSMAGTIFLLVRSVRTSMALLSVVTVSPGRLTRHSDRSLGEGIALVALVRHSFRVMCTTGSLVT